MQERKMREWKMWEHITGSGKCRSRKCGSGKCRSDKVSKAIRRKYSKVPDEIWLSWLSCVFVAKRNSRANRPVNVATEH